MARGDERRRAPRAELAVACTLRRRTGSPIPCRTIEVGLGGMSVCTPRPLAPDELLTFELPAGGQALSGQARVLRQQTHEVYVLRFEQLPGPARERLAALAGS